MFPAQSVAVSDPQQTKEFFASSWAQYDVVETVDKTIVTMGSGPSTVWADVTWTYPGRGKERSCYQLIDGPHGLQIAVLTLLD